MSNARLLALFPGQGSQKIGMGLTLFNEQPLAKQLFAEADDALGFSLSKLCFEGPETELTKTAIAQPAILTVSVIAYRLAQQILGSDLPVVSSAGHSLGEYSALVAAEAIQFADAVKLVNKRGSYMQQAVAVGAGKMLAVIGSPEDQLDQQCQEVQSLGKGPVQIANVNDPSQIVVAGAAEAIDLLKERLTGVRVVELSVSAPFHCVMMAPAAEQLRADLTAVQFTTPKFPVFANFSAQPVTNPDEIREHLYQQVCGRVRWVECMQNAIAETRPTLAVEFGNGVVLSGLLKRINKELPRTNVDSTEAAQKLRDEKLS